MKKLITLGIAGMMMLWGACAMAADVTLKWDAASGATSYKIQMSTDQGATWPTERTVATGTTYTWTGAPDTGLLLFRAVSINAQGAAIRTEAGVWFNNGWKLPVQPGGLGAQ